MLLLIARESKERKTNYVATALHEETMTNYLQKRNPWPASIIKQP